VAELESGPWS